MTCIFCKLDDDLKNRVFYEKGRWRAFLSSVPHTRGHTILAAMPLPMGHSDTYCCPQAISVPVLLGIEVALPNITSAIMEAYEPKPRDILLASLRGDLRHFHLHLVPLWEDEEQRWREVTGYQRAHLMEFLGSLEKRHDFEILWKLAETGKREAEQREECTVAMKEQIERLRQITGYK